ncbi:cupin [Virgibacillus profundi]|uniref:Cupin n=1 Tax=Virgibacillus profundi TaxID=2024555 RepID=A0A2A2IDH1_9BACI|nr:cupin domain-containing protein [Virgibacillus profundi]PAV29677.1 cupin [Virgibacillus profundi]PXY53849.1 cupin domain-containing protein [Virgibacillus profundi]
MEIYHFKKEAGKKITQFNSNFVMSKIINTDSAVHIGCMYLEANGIIGYHQAVVPQLLLILEGEGTVRGKNSKTEHVKKGDAVFWKKGEWHETVSEHGLTAIVIEGEELNPAMYMNLR